MILSIYVTDNGVPRTGLTLTWEYLHAMDGTDKSSSAPAISEIGGGWYKFTLTYGTAPFDVAALVGSIDCSASLSDNQRYIPVNIALRDYAHYRLTNKADYDKSTKVEQVYDDAGSAEIKFTTIEASGLQTMVVAGV